MQRKSLWSCCALAVVACLLIAPDSLAICWGELNADLQSRITTPGNCPNTVPTMTKTYRTRCFDECYELTSDFTTTISGSGACAGFGEGGTTACTQPIVCVPLDGIEIYGHSPPTFNTSIIHRKRTGFCSNLGCANAGSTTLTTSCPCGGDPRECEPLPPPVSPIIISLEGRGYELTAPATGVHFDLDSDGTGNERVAWTRAGLGEAFLALDRDGNGTIDWGKELFGDITPQMPSDEPNGFRALAVFDDALNGGNEDGKIDAADKIFAHLRLWLDDNHNGYSEAEELMPVSRFVEWIDLTYGTSRRVDEYGNEFRYWAESGFNDGKVRRVWDVFLQIRYE